MWFISGEVQGNQTTWGSWTPLNKYPIDPCNAETLAAPPCMVSWGPGRLDIFVLGQGGDMWHICSDNGAWEPWEFLASPQSTKFALNQPTWTCVRSGAPNQLTVIADGNDGNLYSLEYNNDWAKQPGLQCPVFNWVNLGAPAAPNWLASPPTVVSWGLNRVDVADPPVSGRTLAHRPSALALKRLPAQSRQGSTRSKSS
jgi:hypothetical protein